MRKLLGRLALLLVTGSAPAAAQSTVPISQLPVAAAVNPQTDYGVGIVRQVVGGQPVFVTSRVPISKLIGPAGASPLLTGVNVTSLAPGAMPSGNIGGGFPNYVVNLSLPSGPANVVLGSGTFVPGDFVLAGPSGYGVVDGGTPGAAAYKGLGFFLQVANNLSDLTSPATARTNLGLAAVAASGSASDLGIGTLPAARLPTPTTTTLGGVNALPASGNAFLTGIGTTGAPTAAQPAFSNLSGSATAGQMPAFSGDVSTSAGSTATTIQPSTVTNAKLAAAPALTIKGNASGSAGVVTDLTVAQSKTLLGFASSGSNSDITALSGLTTALSAGQGGTGVTTASAELARIGAVANTTTVSAGTGLTGGGALSSNVTLAIASQAVTNALLAPAPAGTLKANTGGSSASPSDVTPSAVLDLIGATQGSILYRGASAWTALGPGTAGQVLGTNGAGANPAWQNAGGNGTVTSVAVSVPADESVTGSPVTSSGTIAISRNAQAAGAVMAGPTSGSAAAPTFRALVPADLPAAADGCVRISVQSTTVLAVNPYGCSTVTIGGVSRIETAHTCSISSPAANTVYYVYEGWSGTATTCSFSTTGHITGSDGREYLNASGSANTAQLLLGMVYSNTTGAPLLNTSSWRGCLNWFNRKTLQAEIQANNTTSSTSLAAYGNNAIFLSWADEAVAFSLTGNALPNTAGSVANASVGVDGAPVGFGGTYNAFAANTYGNVATGYAKFLSEGVHTLQNFGTVNTGSVTFNTDLLVSIRG